MDEFRFENAYQASKGAYAVLILTEWDEFKDLDLKLFIKQCINPPFCLMVGIF